MSSRENAFTKDWLPEFTRRFNSALEDWKGKGKAVGERRTMSMLIDRINRIEGIETTSLNSLSMYKRGKTIPSAHRAETLAYVLELDDPFYFFPEYLVWRSPEEQMDVGQPVLVTREYSGGRYTAILSEEDVEYGNTNGIIAWMPLPLPFEGWFEKGAEQ